MTGATGRAGLDGPSQARDPRMNIVPRIEALFDRWGRQLSAAPHGRLSLLDHALRCADLAQRSAADDDDAMVAAALLHDLGRLLVIDFAAGEVARWPEIAAARFLADDFGPEVLEPIRLQRAASCFLANTGAQAPAILRPDAARPIEPSWSEEMSVAAYRRFALSPHCRRALTLCCHVRQAATPGRSPPPPLRHFLGVLERVLGDPPPVSLHRFASNRGEHRLLCDETGIPA